VDHFKTHKLRAAEGSTEGNHPLPASTDLRDALTGVGFTVQGFRGAHRARRAPWRPHGGDPCDGLRGSRRTPRWAERGAESEAGRHRSPGALHALPVDV